MIPAMNRLADCFDTLRAKKRKALIPFITAGDPNPQITVPLMHALVAAGADVLELGVPFSDPMADGTVIQRASERAVAAGTRLHHVIDMVQEFRKTDDTTPVVLMGYLNPVEMMGYAHFAQTAHHAGVDGVLTVDLPPEEASELVTLLRAHNLSAIFLIAPTTTPQRIQHIAAQAEGYLYYVSLKGVTGSANIDTDAVSKKLDEIRQYTELPLAVGFGIRDAATARACAQISDAVIVGSALVQRLADCEPSEILSTSRSFIKELRDAMDSL